MKPAFAPLGLTPPHSLHRQGINQSTTIAYDHAVVHREDLPYLTPIRGICALAVLFFHCRWLPFGNGGVDVFFILSGYVLTWGHKQHPRSPFAFWWARIGRTWPTHLVATLLVGGTIIAMGGDSFQRLLADLALFPIFAEPVLPINGTTWSLAIEWLCYLSFPFVARGFCRAWKIAFAGCALILLTADATLPGASWPLAIVIGMAEFGMGAAVAGSGWEPHSHRLLGWLDSRICQWLGEISYPLYLIQGLPLFLLGGNAASNMHAGFVRHFGVAVSALCLGYALHVLVETPARAWFKSGTAAQLFWRKPPPTVPSTP